MEVDCYKIRFKFNWILGETVLPDKGGVPRLAEDDFYRYKY